MWKLKHWLFGWDYVYWKGALDQGVARIHKTHNGKPYFYKYKVIDLIQTINSPEDVMWLTCSPSKYFEDYDD